MNARQCFLCLLLSMLASHTNAFAATSYTTDFNLTESPLSEGGVWKHAGLDWTRPASAGGFAYGTQTGTGGYDDSYAYLSGFPPDQSASGVVHIDSRTSTTTTHEVEILLRWSDSASSARGYECNFAYNGQYADIVRWNGAKGDFTFLAPAGTAGISGGLKEGDVVSAQIIGNVITTFVNGTKVLSVVDSTYGDGNPGMGFWRGDPSSPLDDFAFTRFSAVALGQNVPLTFSWRTFLVAGAFALVWYRAKRHRAQLSRPASASQSKNLA